MKFYRKYSISVLFPVFSLINFFYQFINSIDEVSSYHPI